MATSLTPTIAALALCHIDIPRSYDQEEANKAVQWFRDQGAHQYTVLSSWTHVVEFDARPDEAKLKEWFRLQFLRYESLARAYESRRGKNNKALHDSHVKRARALYYAYCNPQASYAEKGMYGKPVWQVQYS